MNPSKSRNRLVFRPLSGNMWCKQSLFFQVFTLEFIKYFSVDVLLSLCRLLNKGSMAQWMSVPLSFSPGDA